MIKETEEDVGPVEGPPSPVKLILRVLGRQERISLFLEPGWSEDSSPGSGHTEATRSLSMSVSSGAVPVFFTCVDRPLTQG